MKSTRAPIYNHSRTLVSSLSFLTHLIATVFALETMQSISEANPRLFPDPLLSQATPSPLSGVRGGRVTLPIKSQSREKLVQP